MMETIEKKRYTVKVTFSGQPKEKVVTLVLPYTTLGTVTQFTHSIVQRIEHLGLYLSKSRVKIHSHECTLHLDSATGPTFYGQDLISDVFHSDDNFVGVISCVVR